MSDDDCGNAWANFNMAMDEVYELRAQVKELNGEKMTTENALRALITTLTDENSALKSSIALPLPAGLTRRQVLLMLRMLDGSLIVPKNATEKAALRFFYEKGWTFYNTREEHWLVDDGRRLLIDWMESLVNTRTQETLT